MRFKLCKSWLDTSRLLLNPGSVARNFFMGGLEIENIHFKRWRFTDIRSFFFFFFSFFLKRPPQKFGFFFKSPCKSTSILATVFLFQLPYLAALISHPAQGSASCFLCFLGFVFNARLFIKATMLRLASAALIINTVTFEQRKLIFKGPTHVQHFFPWHVTL